MFTAAALLRKALVGGWDAKKSEVMDAHVKDVVREMSKALDEERITFPAVVKRWKSMKWAEGRASFRLMAWRRRSAPSSARRLLIANSAAGSRLRAHVGYFVSLAGRRAVYYGRTADEHVEWFPGAKP